MIISIIKKIKRLFSVPTIEHHFFGKMIDAGSYYECRRLFKPTGRIVEIGLVKKHHGPDQKQIDFFNWFETNYDFFIKKMNPRLEKNINELIRNYQIQDFKQEFILEYLYIPTCDEAPFNWSISFYADNQLQHYCILEMNGLDVLNISIEG